MATQPLDFTIIGGNLQAARIVLQPGQILIGEAGCMLFMDDGIFWECRMADGSLMNKPQGFFDSIMTAVGRFVTNESLFFTWFQNRTGVPRSIAVAVTKSGTIVPINLHTLPGSTIIAEGGAFLCSTLGVRMSVELVKKFGAGIFGGEGFFLERIVAEPGSVGQVILHGGGQIVRKELYNEELVLDTGSLFAFTLGLEYDVGFSGFQNAFIGSQLFLTKLRGTGVVWVQSTPVNRMMDAIIARIPEKQEDK